MSDVTKPASMRRWLYLAGSLLVAVALVAWLVYYLLAGQFFIATNDAYIAADSSLIAAKVSGYVTKVAVRNNQPVQKGELLVSIDPRDYQAALAAAKADTQAAQAAIATDRAQSSLQQAKIAAAQADVAGDTARLAFAVSNQRRYQRLTANGASPQQAAEQANSVLGGARAQLAASQAALLGAKREVEVLNANLAQATASLAQSNAKLAQAALDLEHCQLRAPFSGVAGDKSVSAGDYLQTGTQVMALVPLAHVYVTANYKETQITDIRPGQPVTIGVDAFPSLKITGTVDSISPASGQEFALLPPDNATGNFTKIVQRVPVKIDIHLTPELIGKLRPGMSAEPSIDTRAQP